MEQVGFDFQHYGDGVCVMAGNTVLRDSTLVLRVLKTLLTVSELEGEPLVQTSAYTYNFLLPGVGVVFRYDSPHRTHHQFHHRHQNQPFSDDPKANTVTPSSDGNWPLLSDVIDEADNWYWEHGERLEPYVGGARVDDIAEFEE